MSETTTGFDLARGSDTTVIVNINGLMIDRGAAEAALARGLLNATHGPAWAEGTPRTEEEALASGLRGVRQRGLLAA